MCVHIFKSLHKYIGLHILNDSIYLYTLIHLYRLLIGVHKYVSMVSKGNVVAAQFHPEKSGKGILYYL